MNSSDLSDVERYWADKPFKKWVVYVSKTRGFSGKSLAQDRVYVRASSSEKACIAGKKNSILTGRVSVRARLAGPADLGCVHKDDLLDKFKEMKG